MIVVCFFKKSSADKVFDTPGVDSLTFLKTDTTYEQINISAAFFDISIRNCRVAPGSSLN